MPATVSARPTQTRTCATSLPSSLPPASTCRGYTLAGTTRSKVDHAGDVVASAVPRSRRLSIKRLQWKHVDWAHNRIQIRRSKTPAGWRDPSLNAACADALRKLHERASPLGYAEPDHFLFPWLAATL